MYVLARNCIVWPDRGCECSNFCMVITFRTPFSKNYLHKKFVRVTPKNLKKCMEGCPKWLEFLFYFCVLSFSFSNK
jgi:hypothetical protein